MHKTENLNIDILQSLFISNQTLFSSNSAEFSQSTKFYCFSTYFNAVLTKSDDAEFWQICVYAILKLTLFEVLVATWSGFREICQFQLQIGLLRAAACLTSRINHGKSTKEQRPDRRCPLQSTLLHVDYKFLVLLSWHRSANCISIYFSEVLAWVPK